MAEAKPKILCRDVDAYFDAIVDAVRTHGRETSVPINEVRDLTLGIDFPDRVICVRLNKIKILGHTNEWHESLLKLPSGATVKRISRFNERKCLAEFKRRTLEAIKEGERLRALRIIYH